MGIGSRKLGVVAQLAGYAENDRQGRSELVGDIGEEGLAGGLQPFYSLLRARAQTIDID